MKTTVLMNASVLTPDEVALLNSEALEKGITFSLIESRNFLPSDAIPVLISLGESIGFDAAYDVLKYILLSIMAVFTRRKTNKRTTFEVVCNQERFALTCDFPLTDAQRDKLIDAAVKRISDK